MIDIKGAEAIEVFVSEDGTKLWVNGEGGCILRIQDIKHIDVKAGITNWVGKSGKIKNTKPKSR